MSGLTQVLSLIPLQSKINKDDIIIDGNTHFTYIIENCVER